MRLAPISIVFVALFALPARAEAPALNLKSPAFRPNGAIPEAFTCQGKDRSPPLAFGTYPPATKSLVLIVDDPDAPSGNWVHWVLYDVPPDVRGLAEGLHPGPQITGIGIQGRNSFGKLGYGGPCPPAGNPHHYVFKLLALDKKLGLEPGEPKSEVEKAMEGHVIAKGELVGTYQRK